MGTVLSYKESKEYMIVYDNEEDYPLLTSLFYRSYSKMKFFFMVCHASFVYIIEKIA